MSMDVPPGIWHVPSFRSCRTSTSMPSPMNKLQYNQQDVASGCVGAGVNCATRSNVNVQSCASWNDGAPRSKSMPFPILRANLEERKTPPHHAHVQALRENAAADAETCSTSRHTKRKITYRPAGPLPLQQHSGAAKPSPFVLPKQLQWGSQLWVPEAECLRRLLLSKARELNLDVEKLANSEAVKECAQLLHASGMGTSDIGPFSLVSRRSDDIAQTAKLLVFESRLLKSRCGREVSSQTWSLPRSFFAFGVSVQEFCRIVSEGEISPSRVPGCFVSWGCRQELTPMANLLHHVAQDLTGLAQCLIFGTCSRPLVLEKEAERRQRRDGNLNSEQNQLFKRIVINFEFYQLEGFALKLDDA